MTRLIHGKSSPAREAGLAGKEAEKGMNEERRRFERVAYECPAVLQVDGQDSVRVEVENLSLKGVLLHGVPSDLGVSAGDAGSLTMQLAPDAEIRMSLEVVFYADRRLGAHWFEIDVDGMAHLRRLLALNLGDAEQVDRELARMLHFDTDT